MKSFTRKRHERSGNVVVLICMLLPALLGFVALSVDYGFLLYVRTDLQRTADQAVLAAVRDLEPFPDGSQDLNKVRATLREYVEHNAGGGFSVLDSDIAIGRFNPTTVYTDFEILNDGIFDTVSVTVRRDDLANTSVSLYFARIFGNDTADVSATATAVMQKAKLLAKGSDILPIAVSLDAWNSQPLDSTWSIYGDGRLEDELGNAIPGNWGTLDVGASNNSSSVLVDQINNGLRQQDLDYLHSGEKIPSNTHIDSQVAMDLNGDTGLSAGIKTAVYESQGKSKLMPIFDVFSEKGGNLDFHIVGWGVIQIVDSSWQGSRNSAVMVKKSYLYDGDLRPHHDLSNTGDIIDRAFTTPVLVK